MYDFNDRLLYDLALRYTNIPYVWGGDDPIGGGFDCSGLCIELMQSVGTLPMKNPDGSRFDMRAQDLFYHFEKGKNGVYCQTPKFGALVFFGKSMNKITHVGFCMDRWRMLEAGGGGSHVKTVGDAIKYNAYTRIRPIDHRSDRQAVLMPTYKPIGAMF